MNERREREGCWAGGLPFRGFFRDPVHLPGEIPAAHPLPAVVMTMKPRRQRGADAAGIGGEAMKAGDCQFSSHSCPSLDARERDGGLC